MANSLRPLPISAAARSRQTISAASPRPACVAPPAPAAPCCMRCRSVTRSTASRASAIRKGMVARQFGVDMNVVTGDATVAKNLMLVVERCHLNVEAMASSPDVAGLSVLADDEADSRRRRRRDGRRAPPQLRPIPAAASCTRRDLRSAGNTSRWILARGIGACIADAEQIKTLYGTVLTGGSDSRELMSVPTAGDDRETPQIVSRATIANIVRHRAEEIFEMVRDRLADSPFAAEPRARVVLSGGASQLTGTVELATRILNRQVRIGRPLGFGRLAERGEGLLVRGAHGPAGLSAIRSP